MDFFTIQEETCMVIKNFVNYSADIKELQDRLSDFNIKVSPLTSRAAWTMAKRRMERRKYVENISFLGRRETGWKMYHGESHIATFFFSGENLLVERFADKDIEEGIIRDTLKVYRKLKETITTEKISSIVNSFLKKEGATPVRLERGDIYLARDTHRLRDFIEIVEECNLSEHRLCFIVAKAEESTINATKETFIGKVKIMESKIKSVSKDVNNLQKYYVNISEDVKEMLLSLELLGKYVFKEYEVLELKSRLEEIKTQAKAKTKVNKKTRRRILK